MSRTARDSNMEMLRIVSMLLIVIHHSVLHGLQLDECLYTDMFWFAGGVGVNSFVFISGYYMINSRVTLAKMLKLWVTLLTFSLGLYVVLHWGIRGGDINLEALLYYASPLRSGVYWFITTYVLLMLVSPYINLFLHALTKRGMLVFLALLFILRLAVQGCGSAFTWFIFLYSLAAFIRLHGDGLKRISPSLWLSAAAGFACLIFAAAIIEWKLFHFRGSFLLFTGKSSVCSILCSVCLFLGFTGVRLGYIRWVNLASACTLGVYLLHEHPMVRSLLWNGLFHVKALKASPLLIPYCLGAALLVYVVCTCLELLRQVTFGRLYDAIAPSWLLPCASRVWGWMRRAVEGIARRL